MGIPVEFVNLTHHIDIDISVGRSTGGGTALPYYTGEHEITPRKSTEVVLPTKDKSMMKNVTVYKIPYNEVANLSGGNTVTIGIE